MGGTSKEFIFVDESGDPAFGRGSQPFYLLVAMHCSGEVLDDTRRHLASFRYHHNVRREFKNQKWADKGTGPTVRLLDFLAELTEEARLATTCVWLAKEKYRAAAETISSSLLIVGKPPTSNRPTSLAICVATTRSDLR